MTAKRIVVLCILLLLLVGAVSAYATGELSRPCERGCFVTESGDMLCWETPSCRTVSDVPMWFEWLHSIGFKI